jgi:hypothetical protein
LRALNVNQRNFARLAAQGARLVDAHEQVYGKGKGGTRKTRSEDASRLAAKPEVRAAIIEFEEKISPIADLRAVRQEMISNIRYLAFNAPDFKVRLMASIDLRDYADRADRLLESRAPVNVEVLMQELSELRDRQEPKAIEMEAISEASPAVSEADDGNEEEA